MGDATGNPLAMRTVTVTAHAMTPGLSNTLFSTACHVYTQHQCVGASYVHRLWFPILSQTITVLLRHDWAAEAQMRARKTVGTFRKVAPLRLAKCKKQQPTQLEHEVKPHRVPNRKRYATPTMNMHAETQSQRKTPKMQRNQTATQSTAIAQHQQCETEITISGFSQAQTDRVQWHCA